MTRHLSGRGVGGMAAGGSQPGWGKQGHAVGCKTSGSAQAQLASSFLMSLQTLLLEVVSAGNLWLRGRGKK